MHTETISISDSSSQGEFCQYLNAVNYFLFNFICHHVIFYEKLRQHVS